MVRAGNGELQACVTESVGTVAGVVVVVCGRGGKNGSNRNAINNKQTTNQTYEQSHTQSHTRQRHNQPTNHNCPTTKEEVVAGGVVVGGRQRRYTRTSKTAGNQSIM